METVEQLLAYVRVENDVLIADVLCIGGELWLVTEWIESPDQRQQTPGRAIRIDQLPHQREPTQGADLVLNATLPKAALDPSVPLSAEIPCVEGQAATHRFGWLSVRQAN